MCDSIANGGYIPAPSQPCPPANVIIASNVLNTNGNVIAGNIISQDGTFTGNLYVVGQIVGNIIYSSINISGTANISTLQAGTVQGGIFFGNGSGLSNLNASNLSGPASLTNLYVTNSVTTTNISFQNAILSTNLPVFNNAQGTWGSSANVSKITVDQYGRVSNASNVAITSSQWTTIHANVAYGNGVSIGTLSDPPPGSNLYVLGTANVTSLNVSDTLSVNGAFISNATNTSFLFDTLTIPYINTLNILAQGTSNMNVLNVTSLFANSATVFGPMTLNVLGTSNLNIVLGQAYFGNGAGLSNLNASNLSFGVINSSLVYGNTLSNIQFSNIVGLLPNTISNLNASNLTFGVINSSLVYGNTLSNIQFSNIVGLLPNTISNLNASNLTFGVINSSLVYGNTLSNIQFSNIVGLLPNTISNLNASNLAFGVINSALIYGNTISNIQVSNITGYVTGNVLSNLNASNLAFGIVNSALIYGNALSNIAGSNVTGNVAQATLALVVSQASQPNITSVGTLTSLTVSGTTSSGTFSGSGSGLTNVPGSSVTGVVASATTAQVVSQASQPNITSVGTLTSLSVIGTVFAGTFSGSGASLTNVPASSIDGTVATAQSVVTSAQPNITSVGTLTGLSVQGLLVASNGSAISNINAANVSLGTLSTSVFPTSGATAGTYGSSANVSQVTVDQYGRVTSVSNVGFTATSQWTNVNGNVAYGYGVSIGTISNPPNGSNLYVLGTATFTNIAGNGSSISSLNSSNLVGNVANATVALVVSQAAQPNITSVGTLTSLNVSGSSNTATLVTPTANVGTLNVGQISNLFSLTTNVVASIANVGTLNVLSISNLNSLTTNLVAATANVGTLNVLSISNLNSLTTNLTATTANVGTLNVVQISNLSSLTTNLTAVTANVGTLNVLSVANLSSLTTNLVATTANVGILNVISISNLNSLTTNLVASVANVVTLNVGQISNLSSLTTNLVATTANVGTLNVRVISNLSSLTTNLISTTANVGTLNVITISNLNSLTTNLIATRANIATLNVTSLVSTNDIFAGPVRVGRGANLVSTDTVLGANVLLNDPGAYDTAIGYQSMQNATPSVGYDTALGTNTLQSDTGPGYNVAIGAQAMISSAPAQGQDVAIGFSSMQSDTGAGYNTAVGTYSMQNSNPGSGNDVAVGYYAMYNDHGPGYNTALGAEAMQSANPSGGYDVAVGWQALQNDAGGFNTALGANAGQGITGGQYNTALGAGAGPYSSSLYNTTSIGANAQPTVSNVAVFPYGINVGINTGAPGSSLEIQGNLYVSNALTTTNVVANRANLATLNVTSVEIVSNLTISSNIVPNSSGNTYIQGNVVVSGNVYTSLGELGAGGGYYLSLPSNIAVQSGYNGPIYGTAYPLSIGLSNGFTINGTSTLIKITPNGNLKFSQPGPYILNAVFNSSDNITGLAVGSNVADIHGQDQGYLYRYTTFVSQNPTEVITIPINVANTALYYYLDLFKVDQGTIYSSNTGSGGTYLTITPLTGGGLATGGPGGTPGTQWISSGSNIYFPNSVGVGAVNPAYNLDVVGDIHATGNVYSAQRVVTNQSVTYTANALDYYIGVNGTGVTVNLPQGSTLPIGKTYVIKDESGNAAVNHITIAPYSGNLIDGQTSLTMVVNYLAVTILWTGARWSIV